MKIPLLPALSVFAQQNPKAAKHSYITLIMVDDFGWGEPSDHDRKDRYSGPRCHGGRRFLLFTLCGER